MVINLPCIYLRDSLEDLFVYICSFAQRSCDVVSHFSLLISLRQRANVTPIFIRFDLNVSVGDGLLADGKDSGWLGPCVDWGWDFARAQGAFGTQTTTVTTLEILRAVIVLIASHVSDVNVGMLLLHCWTDWSNRCVLTVSFLMHAPSRFCIASFTVLVDLKIKLKSCK